MISQIDNFGLHGLYQNFQRIEGYWDRKSG